MCLFGNWYIVDDFISSIQLKPKQYQHMVTFVHIITALLLLAEKWCEERPKKSIHRPGKCWEGMRIGLQTSSCRMVPLFSRTYRHFIFSSAYTTNRFRSRSFGAIWLSATTCYHIIILSIVCFERYSDWRVATMCPCSTSNLQCTVACALFH